MAEPTNHLYFALKDLGFADRAVLDVLARNNAADETQPEPVRRVWQSVVLTLLHITGEVVAEEEEAEEIFRRESEPPEESSA